MQKNITSSPHLRTSHSVGHIMSLLMAALLPGFFTIIYFFGYGPLFTLSVAILTAILAETLVLILRRRPVIFHLKDGSALVTACLLTLCLPPLTPWWLTVIAVGFAIIVAKHFYGGLGNNPFNPAMVGYVVVLISFPGAMTHWVAPNTLNHDAGPRIMAAQLKGDTAQTFKTFDSISSATPLDVMKNEFEQGKTRSEIQTSQLFGSIAGVGWEWINLAFLLGGLFLLYKKVIYWQIPFAMLTTLFVLASLFYIHDTDAFPTPFFHLFSGGTMLAAFFIATDPVTACTTSRGRLLFGAGIAFYIIVIRTWGGYPDGIAFAILLMNMKVPAIDYFTKPKVFGHSQK